MLKNLRDAISSPYRHIIYGGSKRIGMPEGRTVLQSAIAQRFYQTENF